MGAQRTGGGPGLARKRSGVIDLELPGVTAAYGVASGYRKGDNMRGAGRVVFAAVLLLIAGTLNVIYGIGAISDANFYTSSGTHYVLGTLHTWGWITLILGVIQLTAAFSLFGGGAYGRVIGVVAATLGALGALLAIGTVPFWSLGVFAICLWVAYGLLVFGEEEETRSGV